MPELSAENWMGIVTFFSIFMWGISVLLFGRITAKHIDREMAKEGILTPEWDKGIGGRIIMYAMVIITKKAAKTSPVDDEAILRHTRPKDYTLAAFLIVSSVFFFAVLVIFYFYFSPDNILN
jgi:hypothetical protein